MDQSVMFRKRVYICLKVMIFIDQSHNVKNWYIMVEFQTLNHFFS